jgi:hypothetical protein
VATSEEIDKTAEEIVRGAAEIAEKLRGLAEAIREHTKVANEHVTEFCNKATSVLEGVQELQQKLRTNGHKQETAESSADTSRLPRIEKQGPTEHVDNGLESAVVNGMTKM